MAAHVSAFSEVDGPASGICDAGRLMPVARPIGPVTDWAAVPVSVVGVESIACVLGLSRRSTERAIALGRIPARRIGRRVVASKASLRRIVEGGAR